MVTLRIYNSDTDKTVYEEDFTSFGEAEFETQRKMKAMESRPDYDALDYEYLGHSEDPEEEDEW